MKHGIVIGLAPDRRSGRVLGCLVSADEAIRFVKDAINENRCPDARFPILVAVSASTVLRQHRFTVTAQQVKEAEALLDTVAIPAAEGQQNEEAAADAKAEIASLEAEVIKRDERIKELEGQLAEAVKAAAAKKK